MKRLPALTDDALRRALAPDPGRGAPGELLASIAEEVARTPQRPSMLAWRPWMVGAPRGRRTWVLIAAAATLLLLLAGLLFAGGGRPPQVFRPVLVLPPLAPGGDYNAQYLAVGREDAWVSDGDGVLWHGTAAGWTGPVVSPAARARALALLPDGRLVIAGDGGLRVLQLDGRWSVLGETGLNGMAIDSDGTIWVSEGRRLAGYSETDGGWARRWVDCPAGGSFLAAATDHAIWTGGFAYSGSLGLARLEGTACDEVFVGDGRTHEVYDLAAGPNGQIAVRMADLAAEDDNSEDWIDPGVRTVLWNGSTWTVLTPEPELWRPGLGIGPDGAVFGAANQSIRRHRDGRWETVADRVVFMGPAFPTSPFAKAPDGTLWYASWGPGHALTVEPIPTTELGE